MRTAAGRRLLATLSTVLPAVLGAGLRGQDPAAWAPAGDRLPSMWTANVDPADPWPEYPRPLMTRPRWQSLNGLWRYAVSKGDADRPEELPGQILVPYPLESSLSGVGRLLAPDERLWYQRSFTVPADWRGGRVLLHFGAVDWEAVVFVNGAEVGSHRGGYDPFSFDVTGELRDGDDQELVVAVRDPTNEGGQPRGKQTLEPRGIWYTRCSGIWQSVWMEPVEKSHIAGLRIVPDLPGGKIRVATRTVGADGHRVHVQVRDGDRVVGAASGEVGTDLIVEVADPKPWSPDDPFLYPVEVSIRTGDRIDDSVSSYVGMREVSLKRDAAGRHRIALNGEFLFQFGPLDQGWWPDGLYTAPTAAALWHDVQAVKRFGGNMLRKHVKVEPQLFYHYCDKAGVLVWQDMPNGDNEPDQRANFEQELKAVVTAFRNHPSIVMWVPFNEGWGQYDTARIVAELKQLDPGRLVNNASGWTDRKVGDVLDVHAYPGPALRLPGDGDLRAAVLGEFGGIGRPVAGHLWTADKNWGYVRFETEAAQTEAYVALLTSLPPLYARGLSAAVYTQTSDVEIEVNGWMTYDRALDKIDVAKASAAAALLRGPPPAMRVLVPTAQEEKVEWRYSLEDPGAAWANTDFDDSGWKTGLGGFGTEGTPGAIVGTTWSGERIWLRRRIARVGELAGQVYLKIHHDEDAEVYLNGRRIAELGKYTSGYVYVPLDGATRQALQDGAPLLAIHCRQTSGGQFIDAGIVSMGGAQAR